ncbi:MAG: S24 family peptidase [bacterium]|nr:S24 family peptidase [bacterium]
MHKVQQEILRLAQEKNLGQFTLREIGSYIGIQSPQIVKHHLTQLESKGLLKIDKIKGLVKKTMNEWQSSSGRTKLLNIPILGGVSAGPATMFAETNIEGFLKISPTLLAPSASWRSPEFVQRVFALKVVGDSMNRAKIDGKRIENGDYVIVDISQKNFKNGDIVLSIIDGMANVKKLNVDHANKQIILLSESSKNFSPIYIHENDNFMISGKVIQVIKKPKF